MANRYITDGSKTLASVTDGDNLFIGPSAGAITTSVNMSSFSTGCPIVEIASFLDVGTATAPLYVEVTTRLVNASRSGTLYYQGKDTTDATPLARLIGTGRTVFIDGTITSWEQLSGQSEIAESAIVTNLYSAGGTGSLLGKAGTSPTLIRLVGGPSTPSSWVIQRGATTLTVEAGSAVIDSSTNAITTMNCLGSQAHGCSVKILECGTITTLNAFGHIPDVSSLVQPLTITNTNINMSLAGASELLNHPLLTFTNTPTKYVTEGRVNA
jgi:hypothetical protein